MLEVRLFATFREGRGKVLQLDAARNPDMRSILRHLDIAPEEIAILLINGRHSNPEASVKDGDIIALFPPVGGG